MRNKKRESSPWKDPDNLTDDNLVSLAAYFAAFSKGAPHRRCCDIAFGDEDKWRRNAFDLMRAAHVRGILRVEAPEELELARELKQRFSLLDARVIAVKTDSPEGQALFSKKAGAFLIEQIKRLHTDGPEGIDIAVAGGQTLKLVLDHLEETLPKGAPWLKTATPKIHLWQPTFGLNPRRWDLDAIAHIFVLGRLLRLSAPQVHFMFGPAHAESPDASGSWEKSRWVKAHGDELRQSLRMVVASCGAGEDSYCLGMMQEQNREGFTRLRSKFAGEILFNLYDTNGEPIEHSFPLVRFLPDRTLPQMVRERSGFVSLGIVYSSRSEQIRPKSTALRAAISNPASCWFNYLICTAEIARAVLHLR